MSEHTKKHRISEQCYGSTVYITDHHKTYAIPKKIIEKYLVDDVKPEENTTSSITIQNRLDDLDHKYTKPGALLKGLRIREGLTQVAFAKKIQVTQANLSHMEHGRRPIGKNIAKRIQEVFGTDYRYFLA